MNDQYIKEITKKYNRKKLILRIVSVIFMFNVIFTIYLGQSIEKNYMNKEDVMDTLNNKMDKLYAEDNKNKSNIVNQDLSKEKISPENKEKIDQYIIKKKLKVDENIYSFIIEQQSVKNGLISYNMKKDKQYFDENLYLVYNNIISENEYGKNIINIEKLKLELLRSFSYSKYRSDYNKQNNNSIDTKVNPITTDFKQISDIIFLEVYAKDCFKTRYKINDKNEIITFLEVK